MDQVFTYKSLVHAIAGATGGISAITVFYPLNSVRTILQVSDSAKYHGMFGKMLEVIKTDGLASLYQGWQATVVSLGTSNFVYFYTYNMLKAMYIEWQKKLLAPLPGGKAPKVSMGPVVNLAIASVAGAINVFLTTPLWVVGTRLTIQRKHEAAPTPTDTVKGNVTIHDAHKPYKGIIDCLVRIATEEGPLALWSGVWPSLVLVSNPSIQFVAYEMLRKFMERRAAHRKSGITAVEFFVMGAIAKAVATVLTYPIQVAQSRLRSGHTATHVDVKKPGEAAKTTAHHYRGTIDCLIKIHRHNGLKGLFRGMEAKLWQTVLTAAFQFLTYEEIAKLIFALMLGRDAAKHVEVKASG